MFYLPTLNITYEKIHEDAVIPTYATIGDSGADVYAIEDCFIYPGKTRKIRTGLKIDIPRHPHHAQGYRWELQVRPRGGVSLNTRLRVANSPGTVDNFFRDELQVLIHNTFFPHLWHESTEYGGLEIVPKQVMFAHSINGEKIELLEPVPHGTYLIQKGDKVAQFVFNEVIRPVQVNEGKVSDGLSRGSSFGGTGYNINKRGNIEASK